MLWEICLGISIGVMILPMVVMLYIEVHSSRTRLHAPIFPVGIVCTLLAVGIGMFPLLLGEATVSIAVIIKTVLLSLMNAVKSFTLGVEYDQVNNMMAVCPEHLSAWYSLWIVILLLLAPLFTFGVALSLFRNLSSRMQYAMAYWREMYVFSELTEKSLTLATDIAKNHSDATIVFAEALGKDDEISEELQRDARKLGAILFHGDIVSVAALKHSKKKGLWLFAMGEDDNKNLDMALQLIPLCAERDHVNLYVSALTTESDLLLSAVDKGKVRVRRINDVRSMVYRTLDESGPRLFDEAIPADDGVKEVHAVIVGMGHHGTEMLKALAWYCQMDGYRVHIHAFDRDPLAEEKITAEAPELLSPKYNGVIVEGEAQYTITVHSGYDVGTAKFANAISQIRRASYVLVSLGDDDLNTKTAVQLRMLFARIGVHPTIQAILYDSRRKKAMQNITNYRGQKYDIEFVGDLLSSYSESTIIDSKLELEGMRCHFAWNDITEQTDAATRAAAEATFWNYEYNYRSSIAAALHMQARIHCGIPGADRSEDELDAVAKKYIEMQEHRRWNAYMRSEGYVYSGSPDAASRNDLAKMHHNLVDYDTLPEADKRKDSRIGLL